MVVEPRHDPGDGAPLTPAPARSRSRQRLEWLWLLIPVIAVGSLLASLRIEAEVPNTDEWATALGALGGELQPGDVIWVNPTWRTAPWHDMEQVAVEAGIERGHVFLHASPLTPADVARFRRVVIVGRELVDPPANLGAPRILVDTADLTVQVADVTAEPATDFRAELPSTEVVRVDKAGHETRCPWKGGKHRCDSRNWTAVRETMAEVGDTRRRCIFAYAYPDDGVLRVRYPAARLGESLTGGAGLLLWAVRKDEGSAVDFRVLVDGESLFEATMPRGDFEWHDFDIDTARYAGKTADVTFEVSAANTYWRQMCFDAVAF